VFRPLIVEIERRGFIPGGGLVCNDFCRNLSYSEPDHKLVDESRFKL